MEELYRVRPYAEPIVGRVVLGEFLEPDLREEPHYLCRVHRCIGRGADVLSGQHALDERRIGLHGINRPVDRCDRPSEQV